MFCAVPVLWQHPKDSSKSRGSSEPDAGWGLSDEVPKLACLLHTEIHQAHSSNQRTFTLIHVFCFQNISVSDYTYQPLQWQVCCLNRQRAPWALCLWSTAVSHMWRSSWCWPGPGDHHWPEWWAKTKTGLSLDMVHAWMVPSNWCEQTWENKLL